MSSKKNKRNSNKKKSFFKWVLIIFLVVFIAGFVIYKINPVFVENVIKEVSELKEKILLILKKMKALFKKKSLFLRKKKILRFILEIQVGL